MTKTIKDPTYSIFGKGGNVEKRLEPKGDNSSLKNLKQLADIEKIEAGVIDDLTRELREMFEEEREPGQTFSDWIKTKSVEDLKRIELNDGGKVVDFISYAKSKKPKIKKINLAQGDFDKKVSDLTESDKDLVKELLRKSGVLVGD